jgi:hypothetical protein
VLVEAARAGRDCSLGRGAADRLVVIRALAAHPS